MSDDSEDALARVSMVAGNFGDGPLIPTILEDWFRFLGGRPGEVTMCENGSTLETQAICRETAQRGGIDKLLLVRPGHFDTGAHQCYIAENAAAALATRAYLQWFHIDTLPYRRGRDGWLGEALARLERGDAFAIGGSFNVPSKVEDAEPGWYWSDKCSENFALMPRASFIAAMEAYAGEFVRGGYAGANPAGDASPRARYMIEVAFEAAIERERRLVLCRAEDPDWTVFHTNVHGDLLAATRERYFARRGIRRFLDAGNALPGPFDRDNPVCYGRPSPHGVGKRLRIRLGRSRIAPLYRGLLGRAEPTPPPLPANPPVVSDVLRALAPIERDPLDSLALFARGRELAPERIERELERLGGRPRQVILLASTEPAELEPAWRSYERGLADKLLISRDARGGAPYSSGLVVEHALASLGLCPLVAWLEAGTRAPDSAWLRARVRALAAREAEAFLLGSEAATPAGELERAAAGAHGLAFVARRDAWVAALERAQRGYVGSGARSISTLS